MTQYHECTDVSGFPELQTEVEDPLSSVLTLSSEFKSDKREKGWQQNVTSYTCCIRLARADS